VGREGFVGKSVGGKKRREIFHILLEIVLVENDR